MPRLRKKGHAKRRPTNPSAALIEEYKDLLREQYKRNPGGPLVLPSTHPVLALIAAGAFRSEVQTWRA